MSLFGYCHSDIKYKLFKSFAMALYGSSIWDLSAKSHDRFLVVWRKCVRKIYAIPYRTHCNLLPLLCSDMPPELQLQSRFIKFFRSALQSDNSVVQLSAKISLEGSRSNVGKNITHFTSMANVPRDNIIHIVTQTPVPDQNLSATAGVIRDMIWLRDSRDFSFFRYQDINVILDELCVN